MSYLFNILIMGGIFSMLAVSLDMVCGYAGIISLAHAAFYGIGAYGFALLLTKASLPFWPSFLLGGLLAALAGLLISIPTLRLKGDYLIIATLGFGEIFNNMLVNWDRLTEGPRGVTGIGRPVLFGKTLSEDWSFTLFLLAIWLICIVSTRLIKTSPLGQVLFAIAEDEDGVAALGRNPTRFKMLALCLSAFWAGIAGGLYAAYVGFISPSLFTVNESVLIFTMVLLGGLRSISGAVTGAFVLVMLPEVMRFVGLPNPVAAMLRQMIFGILMILIMLWRPRGLMGELGLK